MIDIGPLDLTQEEDVDAVLSLIEECLGKIRKQQALDSMSGQCEFVIAKHEGKIVACGAYGFSVFQFETWWIGFSAVKPDFRNKQIATQLLDYRLSKIKELGGGWVVASVLPPVERFLKRGFDFLVETPPHQLMILDLKKYTGSLGDKVEPVEDLI